MKEKVERRRTIRFAIFLVMPFALMFTGLACFGNYSAAGATSGQIVTSANTASSEPVGALIPAMIGIHMVSSTTGWAWSLTQVFRTHDAGRTWQVVTPHAVPSFNLFQSASTPQDVKNGTAFFVHSNDAWFLQSWFPNSGPIYGGVIRVFRTTDGGKTWTYATIRNPGYANEANGAVYFLNQRDGWILTYGRGNEEATLWHTTDGGQLWSVLSHMSAAAVGMGAIFSSGTTAWLAYTENPGRLIIEQSDDGGRKRAPMPIQPSFSMSRCDLVNWDPVVLGPDAIDVPFQRTCRVRPGIAFAVTRDGGTSWRFGAGLPLASDGLLAQYDFLSPSDIWLANGQDLYRSVDGGLTWRWIPAAGGAWRFVRADPSNGVYALSAVSMKIAWALVSGPRGRSVALIETIDGGTHWFTVGA